MKISFDWNSYQNYKLFFDELLPILQDKGHKVGVIASLREKEYNSSNVLVNNRELILRELPFEPDFIHLWGETETIGNAFLWKAQKLDEEDVYFHFDPDATELKKFTERWIFKSLDSTNLNKF